MSESSPQEEIARLRANWVDLENRLTGAWARLHDEARTREPSDDSTRLWAKASGVALARDYMRGYS